MSNLIKRESRQKGFGLAEVLLASGVLILVVASVVSLSRFVVRGYALSASRSQAVYLAQEGLEIVRNIRDTWWIDVDSDTDFTDLAGTNYGVGSGTALKWEGTCNGGQGCFKLESPADSINFGGSGIIYTRTISIGDPPDLGNATLNANAKLVTVRVEWTEGGQLWNVDAQTILTNWKPES